MNRKELVAEVAKRTEVAMSQINHTLDHVLDAISEALTGGRDVALKGFGTFSVSKRAARVGRNPQTGATIKIGASKSPKFKPSSQLKQAVKAGKVAKKAAPAKKASKPAAKKAAPKKAAAKPAAKKVAKKAPAKKAPAKKAAKK